MAKANIASFLTSLGQFELLKKRKMVFWLGSAEFDREKKHRLDGKLVAITGLILVWYRSWFGTNPGLVHFWKSYQTRNCTKPGNVPNQEKISKKIRKLKKWEAHLFPKCSRPPLGFKKFFFHFFSEVSQLIASHFGQIRIRAANLQNFCWAELTLADETFCWAELSLTGSENSRAELSLVDEKFYRAELSWALSQKRWAELDLIWKRLCWAERNQCSKKSWAERASELRRARWVFALAWNSW